MVNLIWDVAVKMAKMASKENQKKNKRDIEPAKVYLSVMQQIQYFTDFSLS